LAETPKPTRETRALPGRAELRDPEVGKTDNKTTDNETTGAQRAESREQGARSGEVKTVAEKRFYF